MHNPIDQWMDFSEACVGPAQRMNRISSDVLERVSKLQNQTLEDCLNTNMEQLRALSESQDPSEFLQRETEVFAGTLEKMRKRSEETIELFVSAQEEFNQLFREGFNASTEKTTKAKKKSAKSNGGGAASTDEATE